MCYEELLVTENQKIDYNVMASNIKQTRVAILMDMPLYPYRIYAYNELVKRGYELTVISVSNKVEQYEIPLLFEHRVLSYERTGPFVVVNEFHIRDFEKYDLIIIPSNFRMLNYYQFLRPRFWSKTIRWGHLTGRTNGNKFAEKFRFRFFKCFPALIFYEATTRDVYLAHGFDPSKLFVANNTQYVDPQTIHPFEERKYFLYVGRIQERKGLDIALRSFARIKKQTDDPTLEFVVVGGGDCDKLRSIVQEEGITDAVRFVGPEHDQAKLGDWFSHALAYVSPGHVGLGVLHSFACGVPVITCSGRLHSVEFSNCKSDNSLVVPYTVEDVEKAMESLYSNKDLQSAMSKSAYQYYNDYCTIDKMVDGIDNALQYMLHQK